jgi:hypothetical protein
MSISIYYAATRPYALTEAEQAQMKAIVDTYSVRGAIDEYNRTGVGWSGEDFCLYAPPFDTPNTILEGSTKLPLDDEDTFSVALRHWCAALLELRRLLPDADWRVHLDDHEIPWDENQQAFDPHR